MTKGEYIAAVNSGSMPLTYESTDVNGDWVLVIAIEYLGNNKWLCVDEDGNECVHLSRDMSNPH